MQCLITLVYPISIHDTFQFAKTVTIDNTCTVGKDYMIHRTVNLTVFTTVTSESASQS